VGLRAVLDTVMKRKIPSLVAIPIELSRLSSHYSDQLFMHLAFAVFDVVVRVYTLNTDRRLYFD